jgi:predicted O-methyltransferase YrrM
MHPLLKQIFETKKFVNSRNETVDIHSETSEGQCQFLMDLIRENKCKATVEVGVAFGMSTLAMLDAVRENGGTSVAMDPFQATGWGNNGLDLVKQAGYESSLEFYEEYSYIMLPRFLEQGRKFDFAYIDSTKLLDYLMTDFFYLDKLMDPGGIIVYDDVSFPAIRKLMRYLCQLPNYEIVGVYPVNRKLSSIRKILLKPFVPGFLLKEELRVTDYQRGIHTHCVAIRKTGPDERHYAWFAPF